MHFQNHPCLIPPSVFFHPSQAPGPSVPFCHTCRSKQQQNQTSRETKITKVYFSVTGWMTGSPSPFFLAQLLSRRRYRAVLEIFISPSWLIFNCSYTQQPNQKFCLSEAKLRKRVKALQTCSQDLNSGTGEGRALMAVSQRDLAVTTCGTRISPMGSKALVKTLFLNPNLTSSIYTNP